MIPALRSLRLVASIGLAAAGPTALGAGSARPSAEELLRKAERVRSPDLDYAVEFRLDITDPGSAWKQRRARYTLIARGKDESLVLMREPAPFYPSTLLMTHGLYWMLLPRSDRPLQLSARHVIGGDIANGDLARGNLLAQYAPRYDGEELLDDEPCHRLELSRTSDLGLHPRIVYWISRREQQPRRLDYYGDTGARLKSARYSDYRSGPIGLRSMRVDVESHLRPGERSVLTFSNLRRLDLDGRRFDQAALRAFRDAAVARLEATGEQAEAEELLRAIAGAPGP
jgi:hypothetical protein